MSVYAQTSADRARAHVRVDFLLDSQSHGHACLRLDTLGPCRGSLLLLFQAVELWRHSMETRATTFPNAGGLDRAPSGMAAQIKEGYRLTQEHYAYIYAVHPNTIHRWQKRGLPLDAPEKLLFYLSVHAFCPAALKQKGTVAIMADYRLLAGE